MSATPNFKFAADPCPVGQYCPFELLESGQESSVSCQVVTSAKAVSSNDLSSIIAQTFGISYDHSLPGESCTSDSECFSNSCTRSSLEKSGNQTYVCVGKQKDEECSSDVDCEVGLYCSNKVGSILTESTRTCQQ